MDRGVKIAIFVASVAALCLGLIWDQVLSHARVMVEDQPVDALAGEVIDANIGSPDIERALPPAEEAAPWERPQVEPEEADSAPSPTPTVDGEWLDYVLKSGDSAAKLAHRIFPERGLESNDIMAANPGCKWRVGDTVRIPPCKNAPTPAADTATQVNTPVAPSAGREPIEYVVQEGDSWWAIWKKHGGRCKSWEDIEAANPGVKLRAGVKIKIP